MSDRDVIDAHRWRYPDACCRCGDPTVTHDEHPDHVDAALREARTVRSVEELDALPEGTLIAHGGHVLRNRDFCGWWRQVQRLDGGLCNGYDVDRDQITFPALILWHPKDGAL